MREEALQALRDAAAKVIAEHKRSGLPLVIWRDGKVVKISAEEAEAEYNAAKAQYEAERSRKNAASDPPAA